MTRREICRKANRARSKYLKSSFESRFWSRVDKISPCGCWNWMGTIKPNGYGEVRKLGEKPMTHRVAFEIVRGPIPDGIYVCHTCDNKRCVNPDHLFLGTARDNIYDCINKGRRRYHRGPNPNMQGEKHPFSKLTEKQVKMIRSRRTWNRGEKTKIARQLSVSGPIVSYILSRKIWKHI